MSEVVDWRGFLSNNVPSASAPVPFWGWLIVEMLGLVLERLEVIMSEQDTLNQFVSDLNTAVASVAAEIQALEAANPALDWTAAKSALANLQALEPPAPAPAPEPPAAG